VNIVVEIVAVNGDKVASIASPADILPREAVR
jgi:hypothetical protein